ncbi:MAG: fibrobacter succinogenes major paralogous domain-containing protein [Candidatus Peribacteria bacterium]|nr:fibrobacter succinogenes major paralogous domain-containing protein [Candidatus Peribacteria bacterium]
MESYGNYYTYEEANQICPIGYHLPNKEELQ